MKVKNWIRIQLKRRIKRRTIWIPLMMRRTSNLTLIPMIRKRIRERKRKRLIKTPPPHPAGLKPDFIATCVINPT